MNKRRWVAVAIAVGLFVVSAAFSMMGPSKAEQEQTLQGINALLYGSNELTEVVEESGNTDERIVKLSLNGTIADSGQSGMFSTETYNHQDFLSQLQAIQEDSSIKGVLLEVNTPGGGVYESAEIAKELQKIKDLKIPYYVSMKNMAASGGYYISAGADKIFATDETLTGSIGVIMSGINYTGLFEKLGIEDQTYKSGALKDMGSAQRKPTEEDNKVMQSFVDSAYGRFVNIVAKGRHMSEEQVRKLADGRIYDGAQAKENGLVDEIGFPEDALAQLKKDQKLQNAEVFSYESAKTGFASSWLGSKIAEFQGLKMSDTNRVLSLLESIGTAEAPKPLYYYGGE